MKKALAVVIVLLVLVSAVPFWVGQNVAARVESEVAKVHENPDVRCELTSYRKGWLSSEARLLVGFSDVAVERMSQEQELDQAGTELLRRKVPLVLMINHGPLVLRQGASACWAKLEARVDESGHMAEAMAEVFGAGGERPVWRATVDYAGELNHRLNVPLARFGDEETTVIVRGVRGKGTVFEPNFYFALEVPSIDITGPNSNLRIEEVYAEATVEVQGFQVGEGETVFSVERIETEDPANPGLRLVNIEGVEAKGRMKTDGDTGLAEGGVSYSIAGLRIAEVANIEELELKLDFDRWNVRALEELGDRMEEEQLAGRQGDAAALAPDELRRVSESKPAIVIERLSMTMDGEPLSAAANLELSPPATAGPMAAQQMWLEMVAMDLDVKASEPLVSRLISQFFSAQLGMPVDEKQARQFVGNFEAQGLIIKTDEGYQSKFSMKNGAATLNGNAMPMAGGAGAPAP